MQLIFRCHLNNRKLSNLRLTEFRRVIFNHHFLMLLRWTQTRGFWYASPTIISLFHSFKPPCSLKKSLIIMIQGLFSKMTRLNSKEVIYSLTLRPETLPIYFERIFSKLYNFLIPMSDYSPFYYLSVSFQIHC